MEQKLEKYLEQAAELLMSKSQESYGDSYRGDFLTMYRDYVGSTDNISSRREKANGFFLAINTGFIGAQGYFSINSPEAAYIQAVVGLMFCYIWGRMIKSYKTLNASKFEVIQLMEQHLPLAPFAAEEYVQDNGPTGHKSLTSVERWVPGAFAALHILSSIFLANPSLLGKAG